MKKKFEKIGKPLERSAQKKVAGGKQWVCAANGVMIWPYDLMAPQGVQCCSGCFDGAGVCRVCGGGGGGFPCPQPNEHLVCYGVD